MKQQHILTKTLLRIFSIPKSLVLYPKGFKVTGYEYKKRGEEGIEIQPFYIDKVEDSFLEIGLSAFLEEESTSASLIIERVYLCEKHHVEGLVKERELYVTLADGKITEIENNYDIRNERGGFLSEV